MRDRVQLEELRFRTAADADVEDVLRMMRELWAFEHLEFNVDRNRALLQELVRHADYGLCVVIERANITVGYFVLGFGFSLEFGGRDALLDELYVVPDCRGRGIGKAALEFAAAKCRERGLAALHLEADYFNKRAHALYLQFGFRDHERHLMTLWL